MLSNHIICCCPLLLLLSVFPNIRVFTKESVFPMMWPQYWSFRFSISLSYEYSGLISLRINRLDLFALQGTQRVFSNTTVQEHPFFSTQLFFPRSKCVLFSWLQSPSAVILEPKKLKSVTVSIVSPSICHEVMEPDAMTFVFEC